VLSVGGLALVFLVGPLASSEVGRVLLVGGGAVLLTVGLAVGCGYQVVQRGDRHPDRYRGPAPLLVFATYFFALGLLGLAAVSGGLLDPEQSLGFVSIGALQALGYAVIVWLFVVRTGALSWSAMGWPTWRPGGVREVLGAIGLSVAVMLPTTFVMLILGGLLGLLLGVEAPDVLPTPGSSLEALAIGVVAALVIPTGEELFFRGFALTAWLRDLGPRSALIRSSLFFAVIHIANITTDSFSEGAAQAVLQTAIILPVGFVLGWLFLRRGMSAAIAGHVTYNATLLFLSLLVLSLPEAG
jgi:membrane protease YdiL (CAAX protease family)